MAVLCPGCLSLQSKIVKNSAIFENIFLKSLIGIPILLLGLTFAKLFLVLHQSNSLWMYVHSEYENISERCVN